MLSKLQALGSTPSTAYKRYVRVFKRKQASPCGFPGNADSATQRVTLKGVIPPLRLSHQQRGFVQDLVFSLLWSVCSLHSFIYCERVYMLQRIHRGQRTPRGTGSFYRGS